MCVAVYAGWKASYWDSVGHQGVRVPDRDQLVQQVGLRLKQLRGKFPHHLLQLFRSKTRSSIPGFRLPPVVMKINMSWNETKIYKSRPEVYLYKPPDQTLALIKQNLWGNRALGTFLVPVQVVDGVTPVILDVPAEGREAHADIKPRQRHSTDVSCHMSQYRGVHHRQVVQVPATLEVFLQDRRHTEFNNTEVTVYYNVYTAKFLNQTRLPHTDSAGF